jgi:molybdopterin/thiamine biosynthesis adenylyltransferase
MDFWRQSDIVSQDALNHQPFTLIGAGGIGSVVGLVLAKMGVQDLTAYDPDTVEEHNLPNQFYRLTDVGRPKVEALAELCRDFAGVEVTPWQMEFPLTAKPSGIVICGVDSMSARQAIWQTTIRFNPAVSRYVEARMGAQEGRVYSIVPYDPDHIGLYEASLYADENAVELPCTARAIGYNVFYLAGLLVSQIKKVVMREEVKPEVIFDLVNNLELAPQR